MDFKNQIQAAIGAHGIWKQRLRAAITQGASEYSVSKVQADNQCDFGKFLYEKLDSDKRNSQEYRRCRELHAQFHKAAARVLELALAGKKDEANQAMGVQSEFAKVSSSLTNAMVGWQKAI